MVSNPALCLLARTGRAPKYHVCWEELPTEEEMVQAMLLLNEMAGLSAQGLTGVMVALSFSKCNTRFIKEHKPSNHIRARIKSHVYTTE